jgi:membrane fusion protein (multidrug efflux system)
MATISTLDPIWAYCNVSEVGLLDAEAYARRTGKRLGDATVTLILANGLEHPEKGKLVFIDRAVDTTTGTLRVRAQFPNPTVPPNPLPLLRPGMFGRIRVDLGTRPDSILVPERAVTQLQGKYFVWVVGPDNKTTQKGIKVGQQFGECLLVVDGLKAGDRIVEVGQQKVREGELVRPKTAKEMAEGSARGTPAEAAATAKAGNAQPSKE